jgi:hypothetical protein
VIKSVTISNYAGFIVPVSASHVLVQCTCFFAYLVYIRKHTKFFLSLVLYTAYEIFKIRMTKTNSNVEPNMLCHIKIYHSHICTANNIPTAINVTLLREQYV